MDEQDLAAPKHLTLRGRAGDVRSDVGPAPQRRQLPFAKENHIMSCDRCGCAASTTIVVDGPTRSTRHTLCVRCSLPVTAFLREHMADCADLDDGPDRLEDLRWVS